MWQLITTLIPYFLLWYVIYASTVSLWLTVPLAVLAGAFLVRLFIIFHDCGHGSYFSSRRANDIVGFITGALTFTPYEHWRWHAIHHGTAGHLDKRGTGDIWTMTVQGTWSIPPASLRVSACAQSVGAVRGGALLSLPRQSSLPAANAGRRQRRSVQR